jgi:hypothetical protein
MLCEAKHLTCVSNAEKSQLLRFAQNDNRAKAGCAKGRIDAKIRVALNGKVVIHRKFRGIFASGVENP